LIILICGHLRHLRIKSFQNGGLSTAGGNRNFLVTFFQKVTSSFLFRSAASVLAALGSLE
jgi:hypothetical protein